MNYTTLKNNITSLNKGADGIDQDIIYAYTVNRVGNPVSAIYGYNSAGVNPINGNVLMFKGDGRIVQRDGNTGSYSFYDPASPSSFSATTAAALSVAADRQILGNANPTFYGGISNTFNYKGFDLDVFIRYSGGNKIMNVTRQETLLNQDFNNNGTEILNRWQKEGDATDVPKLYLNSGNAINFNGLAVSRFVEKGDFVRIQNISLGYTLPKTLLSTGKFPITSVRLFALVQNAFTFTKYKGLDPELNSNSGVSSNSQFGIDYNTNPQLRVFTFGLTLASNSAISMNFIKTSQFLILGGGFCWLPVA